MKYVLNAILGFSISMLLQMAGVEPNTAHFWVILALVAALIPVQYISR